MPPLVIIPLGSFIISFAAGYFIGRDKGRSDGALVELAEDVKALKRERPVAPAASATEVTA